ncbi:MAG TPA: hypothetical protein VFX50_15955, partial [Gemmatimonadales bacterium]|nr:hypothetical protein [Gemmatimonadales bacterium]
MLTALLALALAADTTCATPAICEVVAAAARANRTPGPIAAYTADLESEIAVIQVRERVIDGATSVEQVASTVTWERGGTFRHRLTGYRSATTTLPLNRVQYLLLGWVAPVTAGNRLAVFGRLLGVQDRYEWPPADTASVYAHHPLSDDRAGHYRFTALDTVSWKDPAGDVRVVARLMVASVGDTDERRLLFDGELWLELGTLRIVRVRGRLLNTGSMDTKGLERLVRPPEQSFVDLQNLPVDGVWLPAVQRFEWIRSYSLTEQPAGGLRIVTRFRDVRTTPLGADSVAFDPTPAYRLSSDPRASMLGDREWALGALGRETGRYELSDFDDVRLRGRRGRRGSAIALNSQEAGEFVRLNRVEGLFLGAGVSVRPLRAAPGTEFHVNGGMGLEDGAIRWRVAPSFRVGRLLVTAAAARELDHTNEFNAQFSSPALGMLLSRDNWDYVDRSSLTLKGAYFPPSGRGGRLEV